MSSELTQVFVEVYVNGVFYCTDSFWASDEQDVESDITGAIYNYFDSYKPENIHVQLQEVSSDEEDVQEADIKDAVLESVSLVSEDPAGPSAEEINQDGMDASPETSEENIPTAKHLSCNITMTCLSSHTNCSCLIIYYNILFTSFSEKVRKINKMSKFFQKLFGISAQIQKGPAVPEPPCSPEASVPEQKPQVTELSVKNGLEEWTLSETPVTEVWPNIFLGNEETARDRTKLKEMGITHILNTAAVKKKLRVLMGRPKEKDLKGKINTGAKYYRGMNIKYCGLPTTHKEGLKMGVYFLPAAKFINKALRNPENKVLIHCCDGISHSPTLWLAYLMIHHDMNVEEAIDHVTKMRHIKPSISFLTQLMSLNAELVEQRKQQLQAAKCH
ncbi:hypothetical protein Q8A67_021378 [Cirrhinus molitorella]|uniref:Protein-serine/threonine phosphatase n=1 Tax=Cirrhinus molitorella TaxID=172907 RepID=A0AA88TCZ0_9TELE|nr:hypothetical protein Q8A67_021378 [Cirrhinus molitorella]